MAKNVSEKLVFWVPIFDVKKTGFLIPIFGGQNEGQKIVFLKTLFCNAHFLAKFWPQKPPK